LKRYAQSRLTQLRSGLFLYSFLTLLLVVCSGLLQAKEVNGFELRGASVPPSQIRHGGPPRDGIPAINEPNFVEAEQAHSLVLGLSFNGETRAYPIEILNWHELVNDVVGEQGILISYCPLCGTGMAFRSEIGGERLQFGVSGLLYNSDVLFYDRQSESLWSQIKRQAISGFYKETKLEQLPSEHSTWANWRRANPTTQVLDQNQGFSRNYKDDPYLGYEKTKRLFFKVAGRKRQEYQRVLGLVDGDQALAIPFSELRKQMLDEFSLTFAGRTLTIQWDQATNTATAKGVDGQVQVHTIAFWFAWAAFHSDTAIYKAE